MLDEQRFALHFGPYSPPQFQYGDTVMDEVRGEVKIVGLSDAKISWPIGKRGRAKSLVVFSGLAKAVAQESNQAVCHWWGITPQTVTKWRKVFDVEPLNPGSRELFVRYGREERVLDALPLARAAASRPEARRKLAEAHLGKPRPKSVIEALQRANLGRVPSAATRRKMSEAHRARHSTLPKVGRYWSEDDDQLCRTKSPEEVAHATGRSIHAVYTRRSKLGLPDRRADAYQNRGPIRKGLLWSEAEDELVRTLPPREAAQQTGRSLDAVRRRRGRLGLPRYRET